MNRQKLVLTLLLIGFACALVYSYLHAPHQREATPEELRRYAPAPRRPAIPTGPAKGAALPNSVGVAPAGGVPSATVVPNGAAVPSAAAVPGNAAAPRGPVAKGAAVPTPGPGGGAPGRVHLALLEREQSRFTGFKRDIFSPIFSDELAVPPFKPLPPLPKPVKLPPVPPPAQFAPAPVVVAPPPPPTQEQIDEGEMRKFNLLGFLKKNGEKTVFLAYNDEILLAKKGTVLKSRFVVSDLTDDAITLKSLGSKGEVVIPLVENRSPGARRMGTRTP